MAKDKTFIRPKKTYTDTIQNKKDIKKKLKNYIEFPLNKIPIGSHCRYITWDKYKKRPKFCTGGVLKLKRDKFVVLGNGKVTWTVSRQFTDDHNNIIFSSRFFKIKGEQDKLNETIKNQNKIIQKLYKRLKETNNEK